MAVDYFSSLVEYCASNSSLIAAGIPQLYYGSAIGASYPYMVGQQIGSRFLHRNFTDTYIGAQYYQISVYSTSDDAAMALGRIVMGALDPIDSQPLASDEGTQVSWHRWDDGMLLKLGRQGTNGVPIVWHFYLTYHLKIAKVRATA